MPVPFLDLVAQYRGLREEVMPVIQGVLERSHFILGEEVAAFEEQFAAYCGVDHCVGVSSGTEALHLALRALEIGPGDEVITAANSFAATAYAIAYTGATPVFVDVDARDYNLDIDLVEQAITARTRAILPVHLYGQPAEMTVLGDLARQHGLKVVEDACQAHGALWEGRPAGSLGDAGCFSFYPGKNLGAYGDGGAVVTNDSDLADRLRLLRNYGQRPKNVHIQLGYNARLDTLQAAVLLVKLRHLDEWNERRRRAAEEYRRALADSELVLPVEKPNVRHVYHLYVVQHEQRDELLAYLERRKIYCGIHYPHPLTLAAPFRTARSVPEGVPVATRLAGRILSLPIYPELTPRQVAEVADAIHSFAGVRI